MSRDSKTLIYPRPLQDTRQEFRAWLVQRTQCAQGDCYTQAMREALREYDRAETGVLGVDCFCGRKADSKARVNLAPSGEMVCLCADHAKEAAAAYTTLGQLSNKVWAALNPKKDGER